ADDVPHIPGRVAHRGVPPGDHAFAVARPPGALGGTGPFEPARRPAGIAPLTLRFLAAQDAGKDLARRRHLGRRGPHVPERPAADLPLAVARHRGRLAVEALDAAGAVEHDDERLGRVEDARVEVAFLPQRLLGALPVGDVAAAGVEQPAALALGHGDA